MRHVSCYDVEQLAANLACKLKVELAEAGRQFPRIQLAPVPRGGIPTAWAIAHALQTLGISSRVENGPAIGEEATILVDDILVTGSSLLRHAESHPTARGVAVLMVKGVSLPPGAPPLDTLVGTWHTSPEWVQFPWEVNDADEGKPEDAVRRLIEFLEDDPNREGVKDTPRRVLKFLDEMRAVREDENSLTTFKSQVSDLVVVRDIPLFSLCEHHMLPYFGRAHVGYIPSGRVLGLSKVARVVARRAARLSVQEELSATIAEDVERASGSEDVAVVTQAVHTCMVMRGVRAVGSETIASAMTGSFRTDQMLRSEFMSFIGAGRS